MYETSNFKAMIDKAEIFGNDTKSEAEFYTAYQSLSSLKNAISEILSEINLNTAKSYGLSLYENIFGYNFNTIDKSERQNRLIERFMLSGSKCNKNSLSKMMSSLGLNQDYNFDYQNQRFSFTAPENFTTKEINFSKFMLTNFLPAGVEVTNT